MILGGLGKAMDYVGGLPVQTVKGAVRVVGKTAEAVKEGAVWFVKKHM